MTAGREKRRLDLQRQSLPSGQALPMKRLSPKRHRVLEYSVTRLF